MANLPFSPSQSCLLIALLTSCFLTGARATPLPFDDDWHFVREDVAHAEASDFNDHAWPVVSLPHTAQLQPLADGHQARPWQGICWYRKAFVLPATAAGQDVFLRFDGAMNTADVWVNGQPAGHFMGGYLPYVMDVTKLCQPAATNLVAVRLDNRDNPITGPKPLADLDFNLYGGLYRHAHLIVQDKLHITDPDSGQPPGRRRCVCHLPRGLQRGGRGGRENPRAKR